MLHFIKRGATFLTLIALFSLISAPSNLMRGADHAESTSVTGDPGADIADVYAFLSPNDNSKVVLAMTVAGFVVPSQLLNQSFFAPDILYRFEIENTGDAVGDLHIDVIFSQQTSRSSPQNASIRIHPAVPSTTGRAARFKGFSAQTTVQTLDGTPRPFVVTTNQATSVSFFAGLTDDPFYFDIPSFIRYQASVQGGMPDLTRLQRSRDSFAGYNIHTIAIEIPAASLRGSAGNVIGINGITMRQRNTTRQNSGAVFASGDYVQVDRMGVPAINTVLLPFSRKNEYNAATPASDAAGVFAPDMLASLQLFGTNSTNIGILAAVAITNGDFLRLDTGVPNNNIGFGQRATSPGYTGFPNGRRTGDDTIDVLFFYISNQSILMGDNVNSNEVSIPSTFPFFAPPHQPFETPADDRTRN